MKIKQIRTSGSQFSAARRLTTAATALGGALLLGAADLHALTVNPAALAKMSIEELMAVEVTSVAGIGQPRFTAPAALWVLTADDIRRSGHRTRAEALRLVPGTYLARVRSSSCHGPVSAPTSASTWVSPGVPVRTWSLRCGAGTSVNPNTARARAR